MISVIIPTFNGEQHLDGCLTALYRQTYQDFEIIVVDNHSSDGTYDLLQRRHPRVRTILLSQNTGFATAVNRGIEGSAGEYIALLNNDAIASPQWLESLATVLTSDASLGSCASRMVLMEPDGHIDTVGDGFTIAGFSYKRGWMAPDGPEFDRPLEVFGPCGGAALYRREVFERVGLFDESFFMFEEDVDIAFRMRLAGYRCQYVPAARVIHKMRATAGQTSDLPTYYCYRNLTAVLVKNMPLPLLLFYAPHIMLHTAGVLGRHLVRGRLKLTLRAYLAALRRLPETLRSRRQVQQRRDASLKDLRRVFDGNWVAILVQLSSTARRLKEMWRTP